MRFGICCHCDQALDDYPREADYVELSAMELQAMEPRLYRRFLDAVRAGEIHTYSSNGLFPGDIRLTGEVDWSVVGAYVDEIFYKLAELGVRMVVFGSGKAKHVPDGFDRARAWEQLDRLGLLLSDTARQYGQTVAVEPLRYSEVNIINTVAEGAEYCRRLGRDNFKLLVDFYHFAANGEDPATLEANRDLLVHTHIATREERTRPTTQAHWTFFEDCLRQLHAIGYGGEMSFEGGFHSGADMSAMVERMRAFYNTL